ncbi:hypothetical protein ACFE04_003954 [Oxalis oulophora]
MMMIGALSLRISSMPLTYINHQLPPLTTTNSISTVRLHLVEDVDYYQNKANKFWNKFYQSHQNKFFKDRHYLDKDWGDYFCSDDCSPDGKKVLEVGCGAGNTIFPLLAANPELYIHACDFSPQAISLVKSRVDFTEDRLNAFVCNVAEDDLSEKIGLSSVDVVTMIFTLSAVSPKKMAFILQNVKKVIKPNGYVLVRDYAIDDYAQVELQCRDRMISEDYYVRGDGTTSFFFSEDFMSTLFLEAGFNTVDINTYCKKIENHRQKVTMDRRWIRAIFNNHDPMPVSEARL